MSAKEAEGCIAFRAVVAKDVQHPTFLVDAIERFHEAVGAAPAKILYTGRKTARVYTAKLMRAVVTDANVERVTWWNEGEAAALEGRLHLRDDPRASEFIDRWSGVVAPGVRHLIALLEFIQELDARSEIVGAGVAWYPTRGYAALECHHGGVMGNFDEPTKQRLYEDNARWRASRTKLTRLYPLTIIGKTVWESMPPIPSFDPMPRVEDLGNCKLLTAWPTLCEPRDPEFLRGTRALRQWLWPYTIQNPADHIDSDPPLTDPPSSP